MTGNITSKEGKRKRKRGKSPRFGVVKIVNFEEKFFFTSASRSKPAVVTTASQNWKISNKIFCSSCRQR